MMSTEKPLKDLENQDILTLKLKLSPVAWSLEYHYPVHRIGPEFQPEKADESPIHLLVYRNNDDGITFMELNSVSARLINLLNDDLTGQIAAKKNSA